MFFFLLVLVRNTCEEVAWFVVFLGVQGAVAGMDTVPEPLTVVSPLKYLMIQQTPFVRRQVRKLLLFICGSKEKYRQLRDLHTLDSHARGVKKLLEEQGIFLRASVVTASSGSALQYDTLISLVGGGMGRRCVLSLSQVVIGQSPARRASYTP